MDIQAYRGADKLQNPWAKIGVLSIVAGFLIALAGYGSALVASRGEGSVAAGAIFSIGLISVMFLKTELFTGNCLLLIPYWQKKIRLPRMLAHWAAVYAGNLVGAALAALLLTGAIPMDAALAQRFLQATLAKSAMPWLEALARGIGCNLLVCLGVLGFTMAKEEMTRYFLPILFVSLFIICSFEHVVANFFYFAIAAVNGFVLSWRGALHSLAFVTLGNVLGGAMLAAYIVFASKEHAHRA